MASSILILLAAAISAAFSYPLSSADLCPFNTACTCELASPSDPLVFTNVDCDLGPEMPNFKAPSGTKYNITGTLNISGRVHALNANQFAVFESIDTMVLHEPVQGETALWNDHTFDGVQVKRLKVSNFGGMIPHPVALKTLVDSLQELSIQGVVEDVSLEKDGFRDLHKLQALVTDQLKIKNIDNLAFSGLEHYLHTLRLTSAGLTAVPSAALANMEHLTTLNLSNNALETLEKVNLKHLTTLDLSNNNLETLNMDALETTPNLVDIRLDGNPLSTVDLAVFSGMASENNSYISCSPCQKLIEITVSSLDKFPALAKLSFASSSLTKIDPKVGELLTKYPDIRLDITGNDQLICANLTWIAKIVKCTDSVIADETTQCYDHSYLPLRKYLEEQVDPQPVCD